MNKPCRVYKEDLSIRAFKTLVNSGIAGDVRRALVAILLHKNDVLL